MALLKLDFLEVEALEYAKIDAIKNSIIERGGVLIRARTHIQDSDLVSFSKKFGDIVMHPKSTHDGIVKIQAGDDATYLSQSNAAHPFHTDGTYLNKSDSVELVLLHCVKPCPDGGGLNQIMSGQSIVKHLKNSDNAMVFKRLSNDLVGFARGKQKSYRQIFEKDNGKWRISFRLDAAGDVTFSSNDVADAYRDLGDMIHNGISYLELGLREGEILLLDNTAFLHSRTHYTPNSQRLINRVQITNTNLNLGFIHE